MRGRVELKDYLHIARRRWKLIVGCFLVAIAVAALVTSQLTPQYESQARLFVSTPQSDSATSAYQGGLFSEQRVKSYADLASGRELASRVIDDLGLDLEPDDLAGKVSATVVPETVILQLRVTDPSPERAQELTQAYAQELTDYVRELETPAGKKAAPISAAIVDAASLPDSPASPKPLRNIGIAAVLGLLVGFGAAVLRELLDTSIKSGSDAADTAQAPLMGTIPFDPDTGRTPLVSHNHGHPRVEAFRVLRTNLQFVNVDSDSKVFVVTSSTPLEGKTTTSTNLAVTLAQAGKRVVLVEGDLRRPKVSEQLNVEPSVGLTTVLVGDLDLEDAVQPGPAGVSVLTSGALPPNPSELLQSQAMTHVVAELRARFDVIVIDAPPLLPVTDAALLAAHSDGALLVVRYAKTTRDQVQHSVERLSGVDGRLLGVVLNMVPARKGGYGYGYGYGYGPEGDRPSGVRRPRHRTAAPDLSANDVREAAESEPVESVATRQSSAP